MHVYIEDFFYVYILNIFIYKNINVSTCKYIQYA